MDPAPAWLAHLVLAETLPPGSHLIAADPACVPLLNRCVLWSGRERPVRSITSPVSEGRAIVQMHAGAPPGGQPVIAVKDRTDGAQAALHAHPTRPDAILWTGAPGSLAGYAPCHTRLPHLALSTIEDRGKARERRAMADALLGGVSDALDALAGHCRAGGALLALSYAQDGGAILTFDPLAFARCSDPATEQRFLASGTMLLERWTPCLLRLPTLGESHPRYEIGVDIRGRGAMPVISAAEQTRRIARDRRDTGDGIGFEVGTPGPGYCSITLTGHRVAVTDIRLYLPPAIPVAAEEISDPLAQYDDPLGAYGQKDPA